jgi:hypothetical protein
MNPLSDQWSSAVSVAPRPGGASGTDQFRVTGVVNDPGTAIVTADLDHRAHGPTTVRYVTRTCDRLDTVHGVPVHELIAGIGLRLRVDQKMDQLMFVILARGQDGYQVVLSWGEVDPEFGGCAALLATRYNDVLLPRPTLVLPRDDRGSRYVRMISELRVLRVDGQSGT